ncbi:MAG: sensor domain-containing phosphodiesterase [Lachnospiraceae bacterium]|nr:sensor domain-containing phosphodiesterase [Lachnospiraceae bacterium]
METSGITDILSEGILWLVEESKDTAYIINAENGTIVYMNTAGKIVFGVGDDVVGEKADVVGNTTWDANLSKLTGNKYYTYEYYNEKVNCMFVVKEKLVKWDGELCILRMLIDISTVEHMENTIAGKIYIENTLLNFIGTLARSEQSENNDEVMNYILELIGKFYSADRAYIIQLLEKDCQRHYLYQWTKEGIENSVEEIKVIDIKNPQTKENVYKKRMPILIRDIEDIKEVSPEEYNHQKRRKVRSIYAVPYMEDDKVKGFVGVDNPELTIENFALLKMMTLFVEERFFRHQHRVQQEYNLYHDKLTGQKNRNSLRIYSKDDIDKLEGKMGVAVANINGLRDVNRDFGQEYGDNMVVQFAEFLEKKFQGREIFRLDGDEFVVVCQDISYEEIQKQVLEAEKESESVLLRGASFGYAWTEENEKNLPGLIHSATQLMILSKRRYYEKHKKFSKYSNGKLLESLLEELKSGNFMIYIQPKIDVTKEELVGMEALIRYQKPDEGLVPPGKFVPLLEKEGLICYIDFFVLEQACSILAKWKKQGNKLVPISVNFSRKTMREKNVAEKIASIVKKYDVPSEYILIEITETEGDLDREAFVDIGSKIIKSGFGISLDDFCSQYSCVSLLTALPFKEIKFDKSMIDRIAVDENMKLLCESMMDTCNKFGYNIVAEGVETVEQLSVLRGMNCNAIQGYYYCKPLSIKDFEEKYFS